MIQTPPSDDAARNLAAQLETLWASYADELVSKVHRIDELIGASHWLSVGTYKETLLKSLLRNKVPQSIEVGTGFVLSGLRKDKQPPEKKISKQLDILAWNAGEHAPIFRADEFVIVPSEACKAVIEVKGHLTQADLNSGIENLDSVATFGALLGYQNSPFTALFAFDIDDGLIFPDSIFNALWRYYTARSKSILPWRLGWTRRHEDSWRLPWIKQIVVLNKGVVSLMEWDINGEKCPVYVALKTITNGLNDSYAFMERDLLMTLKVADSKIKYPHFSPGSAPIMFSKKVEFLGGQCFMVIPLGGDKIHSLGRVKDAGMDFWRNMQFTPRKPRHAKGKKRRMANHQRR